MGNMGMAMSEMAEKLERMDRRTQVEAMADYPMGGPGASGKLGMLDQLDATLQRLMEEIDQLEHALSGVRSPSSERSSLASQPQEAASNRLHEFILRAEVANQRLRTIKSELSL